MYRELFPLIQPDVIVLTPNRRLTQYLCREYDQFQQAQQLKGWYSPTLLAWEQWLSSLWHSHYPEQQLLSDYQELLIWQQIVLTTTPNFLMSTARETATLAREAWRRLRLWNLSIEHLLTDDRAEVNALYAWSSLFMQKLKKFNWQSTAELPHELLKMLNPDSVPWPKKIILVGFESFTPSQQVLLQCLKQYTDVIYFEPAAIASTISRLEFQKPEDEWQSIALYIKKKLMTAQKPLRIGCVVPDLASARESIRQIFTDIFHPEFIVPGQSKQSHLFNISAGASLATYPLVQAAFQILNLTLPEIDFFQFSHLLRSPFINGVEEEAVAGNYLDTLLKERNTLRLTAELIDSALITLKQYFPASTLPLRWLQWQSDAIYKNNASVDEWVDQFKKLLTAWGWPGERQLNSSEYQTLVRFYELLAQFTEEANPEQTLLSQKEALDRLHLLAETTIFQPQSDDNAPVQILGSLEASGSAFDVLWIAGLDDETWPNAAKPNPFLPIALQREQDMPHASAKRQLQYTEQLQQRLLQSATEVYLSASLHKEDQPKRTSRLITKFPLITVESLGLPPHNSLTEMIWQQRQCETRPLESPLPVGATESILGGASILQLQSVCAFRAFAKIRLQAKTKETPKIGLSSELRGSLLHQVLDGLWRNIKSQQQLLSYSDQELKALIHELVITAVNAATEKNSIFAVTEIKRLSQLILKWLQFEKERPPFSVIARETIRHIRVLDQELQLQIDRIDQLSDGRYFIIDYKSKIAEPRLRWFDERLTDIQLPLYCVYGMDNVSGIAYAEVKANHFKFLGILDTTHPQEDCFSEVSDSKKFKSKDQSNTWSTIKSKWQQQLEQLASDFRSGQAIKNPIDAELTCQYCDLQSLCRIQEQ